MANDFIKLNNSGKIMLYRSYTANGSLSATQYLPETQFKLGISNTTPASTNNDLDVPIPIYDGVVNDTGENQLTGSNGGDNTTDNTTTYKPGANEYDNTSQNLLTTGSNTTKTWTISNLATNGTVITATKYGGCWFYIKDATTLAKIVSITIKLGSDSSNYYSLTILNANLSTFWNWFTDNTIINTWTETGTVSGTIDTFIIEIVTNNASDAFVAGDVCYDLLRTWDYADMTKDFTATYPVVDLTNLEITKKGYVTSIEAVGFDVNGYLDVNEDTSPLATDEATYTAESKADTDEIIFVSKSRLILS